MEFSGYFSWCCAPDATRDEEDEDHDCYLCLVCMQAAMEFIEPLFSCAACHPKYPICSWTLQKWHLFLGHSSPSGI